MEDGIQMGMLGLARGVDLFEPSRGYKLSTYAYWWIRQSIMRGIANQRGTIRIPVHQLDRLAKFRRLPSGLNDAEVAEALSIDPRAVPAIRQAAMAQNHRQP